MHKRFQMKNILSISLVLILLVGVSCQNKGYPKPDGLPSQNEMVDILYEIHLAEAIANRNRYTVRDSTKIESDDMYQAVLEKHGLNDSIMAMSVIYYSGKPKVYEKIYSKVVERLNVKIEDMKKKSELKVESPEAKE